MVDRIEKYRCRICHKEYETKEQAEYCESQIPPKDRLPGTVFATRQTGDLYLIIERYKGVREHFAVFLGHKISRVSYPDEAPAAYNVRSECIIEISDFGVNKYPLAREIGTSEIERLCKIDRGSIEETLSIINFNK